MPGVIRRLWRIWPTRSRHAAREGIEAVRSPIQEIVVTPGAPYTPPAVEIRGDLASLLGDELSMPLVAGAGFEPATFRL